MAQEEKENSAEWMQKLWRPAMGWMYMLICLADMIVFPVLWSLLQAVTHTAITQWNPLTLQGAGLFHIAMGAVLGIAAFGRTQEKLNGANNGGAQVSTPAPTPAPTTSFTPAPSTSFTPAPSWGTTPTASNSFNSNPSFGAPAAKPAVALSSSGKPMPAPQVDQEI